MPDEKSCDVCGKPMKLAESREYTTSAGTLRHEFVWDCSDSKCWTTDIYIRNTIFKPLEK